jgi:hypothetical protein
MRFDDYLTPPITPDGNCLMGNHNLPGMPILRHDDAVSGRYYCFENA